MLRELLQAIQVDQRRVMPTGEPSSASYPDQSNHCQGGFLAYPAQSVFVFGRRGAKVQLMRDFIEYPGCLIMATVVGRRL